MKTFSPFKKLFVLIIILFCYTSYAQNYNFTLEQNSDYNYTISAVSLFDSGSFQPITQSYGFTLVLPDGVTVSIDEVFPSGTNETLSPIPGTSVQTIDPSMSDKDLFLITTDTSGLTLSAHGIGAVIPLVTLTVVGNPTSGEIRLLDNASTLASSSAINGALDSFIQVDVTNDGTVNFINEFDKLTGNEVYSFNTLSIPSLETLELSIYPNPVDSIVYLKGNTGSINQIDIININGQLVKTIDSNFNKIDVSQLDSAIYLVKIHTSQSTMTKRLVKY